MPSKKNILDLYFIDARHKLIDIAAFLDRVDRHEGDPDFRLSAFHQALQAMLNAPAQQRAKTVLESLSDHSPEPIPKSNEQGACGAPLPTSNNA